MFILINGQLVPSETPCLSVYDRGFTLGHGLFETMLLSQGRVPLLAYHWHRLKSSAALINIALDCSFSELEAQIHDVIMTNELINSRAGLRLTLTDGVSERGILSQGAKKPTLLLTPFLLSNPSPASWSATLVSIRKNEQSLSSQVKSLSYLDNILAKQEAVDQGFDEAILLNTQGFVADGAISNVFLIKNQVVYTPKIRDGALPGVLRHVILHELDHGIPIQEASLTAESLQSADALFLTNALMGIMPINKFGQQSYPVICQEIEVLTKWWLELS
jgi:branched-chain amino acid aminotransferase